MNNLERKFRVVSKDLELVKQKLATNFKNIESHIETTYELRHHSDRLRVAQSLLVDALKKSLHAKLKEATPKTKAGRDSVQFRVGTRTICSLTFSTKGELNLCKKLHYFHLYNEHYGLIEFPEQYAASKLHDVYALSSAQIGHNYLVVSGEESELRLVDSNFEFIKKVSVRSEFKVRVYSLNKSRLVCLLFTPNYTKLLIYLFDAELTLRKRLNFKKLLDFAYYNFDAVEVHQCEAANFVLKFSLNGRTINKYFVFDFQLALIRKSDAGNLRSSGPDYYFMTRDKFVYQKANKIFLLAVLKNKIRETKSIISLVDEHFKLVVDMESNIYIVKSLAKKGQALVYCYDLNGKLVFKNTMAHEDLCNFDAFHAFDNHMYICDESSNVVAII